MWFNNKSAKTFLIVCCFGFLFVLINQALADTTSYTTPGTYTWTCPAGVTSVSLDLVGGGGGGGGGGEYQLIDPNSRGGTGGLGGSAGSVVTQSNISVTSGSNYSIVVGSGGSAGTRGIFVNNGGGSYSYTDASNGTVGGNTTGLGYSASGGGGGGAGTKGGNSGDGSGTAGTSGTSTSYAGISATAGTDGDDAFGVGFSGGHGAGGGGGYGAGGGGGGGGTGIPSGGNIGTWYAGAGGSGAGGYVSISYTGVNGVCGTASGHNYLYTDTTWGSYTQCASGNVSATTFPGYDTIQYWSCMGINGGTNVTNCNAYRAAPPAGTCGTASGRRFLSTESSYASYPQCSLGTSTSTTFPTGGTPSSWYCANSGVNSPQCSASRNRKATIANGTLTYSVNTSANIAFTGFSAADADSDTLTYAWSCTNGGTFTSNAVANPTYIAPSTARTDTCTLIISDGYEGTISSTVTITVNAIGTSCGSGGGLTCTQTTDGLYTVNTFTGTGTYSWTAPAGVTSAEVLIVAGGGGGGEGQNGISFGGSGGAGGLLNGTLTSLSGSYTVTVGSGGANGPSVNTNGGVGGNSVFGSYTAYGGGYGGGGQQAGGAGGSGGGGSGTSYGNPTQTTQGTLTGFGNRGGTSSARWLAAGGGGATGVGGADNAYAANGKVLSITGSSVTYALGAWTCSGIGTSGLGNGGGGGDGGGNCSAKAGGSGIVIIRYLTANPVDGTCGTAATTYSPGATAFSGTMCAAGNGVATPASPSFPEAGSSTTWTCGGSSGGNSSTLCTASRATDGICGSSNGQSYSSTSSIDTDAKKCAGGTYGGSFTDNAATWTWACNGIGTGAVNGTCYANKSGITKINGKCGTANYSTAPSVPTQNLCVAGIQSAVTTNATTYTWICGGIGGGTDDYGVANMAGQVTNGTCGSSNTKRFTSIPTINLCGSGVPTAVSGNGPWTWTCNGVGTGATNQACSATKSLPLWQEAAPY